MSSLFAIFADLCNKYWIVFVCDLQATHVCSHCASTPLRLLLVSETTAHREQQFLPLIHTSLHYNLVHQCNNYCEYCMILKIMCYLNSWSKTIWNTNKFHYNCLMDLFLRFFLLEGFLPFGFGRIICGGRFFFFGGEEGGGVVGVWCPA